ncbi:hypothetical protein C8J57DRAFT_1596327 [Mycena rebaudengoi]|nr:hypothetical protein C8J57DRAFT_1596327 [Mycena rebaudengoi]
MAPAPTYPITGIASPAGSPPGEVPLRVEADTFFQDFLNYNPSSRRHVPDYVDQCNLFLLAMAKFQSMDNDEKLSYFQVAGIHSMPYITWDDPKHPQRVYEIMIKHIIPTFHPSDHARLEAEAQKWRLPYWDWATKKTRGGKQIYDVPLIFREEKVTVTTSTGQTTISNPLWMFSTAPAEMGKWGIKPVPYDPSDPSKVVNFQECTATSKAPPNPAVSFQAWANGVQNVDAVAQNLQAHVWYQEGTENFSIGEAVYRLLSLKYITSYRQFATTAYYPPNKEPRDALSWEGIHNNVHNWTGGDWGHMTFPEVASFDPIFWMHHANIDRVFAIYQDLYSSVPELSWWSKDEVTSLTPETPLAPFHKDTKGTKYDSNDIRYITALGYTYPELQRWKFPNEKVYHASILAKVRELYAPPAEHSAARTDYIVNVIYERFAFGGIPFTIQVLLRNKLVGSVYTFSNSNSAACENCLRQEETKILSSNQITLTGALIASIKDATISLDTLDRDTVKGYLQEHLKVRAVVAGGAEIQLPNESLQVSVAAGSRLGAALEEGDKMPMIPIGMHKPMSELPAGNVTYGDTFAHHHEDAPRGGDSGSLGTVYEIIEITPEGRERDRGRGPIRWALTGYTPYTEVLSL